MGMCACSAAAACTHSCTAPALFASQVSFLAAMVGPKVAATAASRALEVLGEQAMPPGSGEGDEVRDRSCPFTLPPPSTSSFEHSCFTDSLCSQADLSQVQLQPSMVLAAATSSLQAAAARARQLADQEDREMQRLVTAALQVQGQKVQTKLKYLASLNQVRCSFSGCQYQSCTLSCWPSTSSTANA